jgi:hypothetical protein
MYGMINREEREVRKEKLKKNLCGLSVLCGSRFNRERKFD